MPQQGAGVAHCSGRGARPRAARIPDPRERHERPLDELAHAAPRRRARRPPDRGLVLVTGPDAHLVPPGARVARPRPARRRPGRAVAAAHARRASSTSRSACCVVGDDAVARHRSRVRRAARRRRWTLQDPGEGRGDRPAPTSGAWCRSSGPRSTAQWPRPVPPCSTRHAPVGELLVVRTEMGLDLVGARAAVDAVSAHVERRRLGDRRAPTRSRRSASSAASRSSRSTSTTRRSRRRRSSSSTRCRSPRAASSARSSCAASTAAAT